MAPPGVALHILGPADLSGVGRPEAHRVLAHAKRLALLSYLATAPSTFHRRDSLCALLWPEADTERARSSLRQAVHQIRRALGPDAIIGRGEEELAAGPVMRCDAAELAQLASAGDHVGALALYRGDLLTGFHVGDAPAFGEWLDAERARLRAVAVNAAWAQSADCERRGEIVEAARWARRAADLEPLDEDVHQRLIATLDRLGTPRAALQAFDQFARRLAREFQTAPDAATLALAARIRAHLPPPAAPTPPPPGTDPSVVSAPVAASMPDGSPAGPAHVPAAARTRRRTGAALLLIGALLATLTATGLWRMRAGRGASALDSATVVIAPFRVSASDSALHYLDEGLPDLLAARLGGDVGPRAVDARAVLSAWRRTQREPGAEVTEADARRLAQGLGAGSLILGSMVETNARLALSAALLDVVTGDVRAQATASGPLDSLPDVMDRLASLLLATAMQEPLPRLAELTSAEPNALRAYLMGRRAYRRGRYTEAMDYLRLAFALDTTSAIIALQLAVAADWVPGHTDVQSRAVAQAQRHRDRLSPADRAILAAVAPGAGEPIAATLANWEHAVEQAPDRPEAWFGYGDELFHNGAAVGRDSGFARAGEALGRAIALDSTYTAPILHLAMLAAHTGDVAAARRLGARFLALEPDAEDAVFVRWRVAVAEGDSATVRGIERNLGTASPRSLAAIATWAQLSGIRTDAARRAADLLVDHALTTGSRLYARWLQIAVYDNAGRMDASHRQALALAADRGTPSTDVTALTVSNAIFLHGDSLAAERAVIAAEAALPGLRGHDARTQALWCLWWRLYVQPAAIGDAALRTLEERAGVQTDTSLSTAPLRVMLALRLRRRLPPSALADLDSAQQASGRYLSTSLAMGTARALEQSGDARAALRTLRRRQFNDLGGLNSLAGRLAEEGRVALAVGDTTGALRAWRHYLALRPDPDPGVRPRVDAMRAQVARLERP